MQLPIYQASINDIKDFFRSYKFFFLIVLSCILSLNTIHYLRFMAEWNDTTIIDGILYQFSLYTFYYLIYMPLGAWITYKIVKPSLLDNFVYLRLGTRKKMILSKMLSCILLSFFVLFLLVIISVIILSFNFEWTLEWSESMLQSQSINGALLNQSLLYLPAYSLILYQFLLLFGSYIASNWFLLFLMEISNGKTLSLVIILLVNYIMLFLAKNFGDIFLLFPFSNTFLCNINLNEKGTLALIFPVLYWIIINNVLYKANCLIAARKDFLYADMSDEEL